MRALPPTRFHNNIPLPETAEADYAYTYSSATNESDWRDYWKILVKRRRLFVFVFLLVVGLGSYFSITATNIYNATSVVKIEPQNPAVTSVAPINATDGSNDYYATQYALMKSRRLAAKVITELKLDSNPTFTDFSIVSSNMNTRISSLILHILDRVVSLTNSLKPRSPNKAQDIATLKTASQSDVTYQREEVKASPWVGRYLGLLTVNPLKGTRLVEVQFKTPNPVLSQVLANTHARDFIAMNMESRQELTEEARQFLDKKNAELKEAVEKSEEKLNLFRQTHGVVSMDKGENIVVDRLVDVNRKLTEARAQRLEAESLKKTVENRPAQYLSQVITQGLVPSLRASLQSLESERVKLSSTFKPDHPRMVELNQQITEARRALNAEIANVVKGIQENYAAAHAKEQALQGEAQKQQESALNMKQLGVEYAVLEEEVKVNRALYENVLNRLHSTSVTNDLAMSNMQIVQLADKPGWPSSPNTLWDLGLAAALGLFLAGGLSFGLEYLDSSVGTPQHVWQTVGLSTLGVVPDLNSLKPLLDSSHFPGARLLSRFTPLRLPSRSDLPGELIVQHHPLSMVTECYRTIRTALLFAQAETPPQVILLTSPSPGEGKTVTSLNLSVALTHDGYKVLLIDADLRKGHCHSRLGLSNRRGLSHILTGNTALEDGIQETSVSGLSFISRGVCPPNPSDLLGSSKMKELIEKLRETYNFIVIDSPPAIAVSDASVLSASADGVLLVFHAQKTTCASARQVIERLETVRAAILGSILNGVNVKDPDYAYYRYYYGSDYGAVSENKNGSVGGDVVDEPLPKTPEIEISSLELGSGVVSRQFLNTMTSKFSEAVGPMASVIVIERVALLGESFDSFPKSRLKELLEAVCQEILDQKLRQEFQNAMAKELSSI